MDKSRIEDIKELKQDLADPSKNAEEKRLIKEAGSKIRKEQQDKRLRDARHQMINERLQGNQGNVKDVQDRLINGIQSQSYGFNVSQERWDQIFNG